MNIRAKVFGGKQPAAEPILRSKKPKGATADTLHSVAVPREARRLSSSRGEDRHRLSGQHVLVTYRGAELQVELINLSGGGAMIEGEFAPLMWDRVDLHLGDEGKIECAVRWIRGSRVGLEFAHETRLDAPADEVAAVLRQVIEKSFPHIAFELDENYVPPAPKAEWTDEQRDAPRHPLIWTGTLHHNYQSDSVRIRNISATGAMIETTAVVRVGSEPLFELTDALSLSATVQWGVGDQVGLRFHSPFDLSLLAEARPMVATTGWSPPPFLDPAQGDAREDRWNRLSLGELHQELEGFLKR